jgi:ubiquinone/menaquinone biosynthesis C-methylase UbiE
VAERAHPEDAGFQDKWFGLIQNKYKKNLKDRYRFCQPYVRGQAILDIPCGVGWGTSLLKGYKSMVGIDISPDAIRYANSRYANSKLHFLVGNMGAIPAEDNSFDNVICLEGFEHISREIGGTFLTEVKRVLRRNGLFIMTCPILNEKGETTGNPYHLSEYSEEEFIDIMNLHFRIERLDRFQGPDGSEYKIIVRNFKEQRYSK